MHLISLSTAVALTGLTKRTLWRYIESGRLTVATPTAPGEKAHVHLQDILTLSGLTVAPEDHPTLVDADRGDPIAQCDLAILLMNQRPADAIPWFQRSANAFYPDAMCWLARAYLSGQGIECNLETGVQWIDKAAHKGHPLGQALHDFLQSPSGQGLLHAQNHSALKTALDDIERQTLLNALNATADAVHS
ncbi:sel1 repeat family protein [Allochromatium palmeri]|uniref:Sel1 repeat family protein n=1 Tax=Allochromatium palmeri TaxID=231048 RepID=A0A6N8ECZ6_9GAMM|nr:sel1 repeat family protein [Allochromatium palmeri]MTW22092.1 hypothetical protein [Allochromatium palmeri]